MEEHEQQQPIFEQIEDSFNLPIESYVKKIQEFKGLPQDIDSLIRAKEYVSSWLIYVRSKQNDLYEQREITAMQLKLDNADEYLKARSKLHEEDGRKFSADDAKFHAELMTANIRLEYVKVDSSYRRSKDLGDWLKDHLQDIRQKIAWRRDEWDLDKHIKEKEKRDE